MLLTQTLVKDLKQKAKGVGVQNLTPSLLFSIFYFSLSNLNIYRFLSTFEPQRATGNKISREKKMFLFYKSDFHNILRYFYKVTLKEFGFTGKKWYNFAINSSQFSLCIFAQVVCFCAFCSSLCLIFIVFAILVFSF